jgi:hypothetical protein
MEVELTSDQKAFARRVEFQSTLDEARDSLARGEGREITQESMQQLSAEVRERGRARLLADM